MTALAKALDAAYLARAIDDEIRYRIGVRRWHRTGGAYLRWTDYDRENTAALLALLRVRSAAKRRAGR